MIRVIFQYEIDNSLQEKFIDVMEKVRAKHHELYPDISYNFFFQWNDDKIEKVYYFFEFKNEEEWNTHFDTQQTDRRWIDFVIQEYYPYDFVLPKTGSLNIVHEIGQKPLNILLGGFDYSYDNYQRVDHPSVRSVTDPEEWVIGCSFDPKFKRW